MSTDPSPRAEQIQANVAAALSRLRGEPAGTPQPLPVSSPETGLTNGEALFAVEAKPASVSMGAPDPSMALGSHGGSQPGEADGRSPSAFERVTGLKAEARLEPGIDEQPDLLQGIGVPPPPLADLPDADEEARRRRRRRNRLMLGAAAIALLAGFWFLSGGESGPQDVPVIAADGSPEKVKPEEEGGLTVPNQDVAILNNGEETAAAATETVVPAPEQPAAPPAPPPTAEPPAPVAAEPAAPATVAAPAIPSVTAPDVAAIPSVAAPTELGAPAAAAPAAAEPDPAPVADAASTGQPATAEPAAAPTQEAAAEEAPLPKVSAAIQPVPGGTVRIQLASVKSEDSARSEWARLQRTYPAILGGLELNIERFEKSAGDVYYRIQAGPLGDRASAKQICEDLKQKNQACIVAK